MDKPDYEYTPGEWVVGMDGLNVGQDMLTITSPEYRKECDANHVVAYILTRGSRKMSAANASLVAAAPELLSVCKNLASDFEALLGGDDFSGMNDAELFGVMLASLQQAIAKAEGGD
jgi:hypothetical protein